MSNNEFDNKELIQKNPNKKISKPLAVTIGIICLLIILGVSSVKTKESLIVSEEIISAQKIEIVHFHGTQQCISCITVGEFALKTIKERFPEEYANGTIVFKDINGELPENRDLVMKYKVRGSSLFVNAISNDTENIKEDTTVWFKISNEQDFLNYFENKLKKLLAKS